MTLRFQLISLGIALGLSVNAQTQTLITEHGYRFIQHSDNKGMKPKQGESAMFRVNVYAGDIRINSSDKNPGGAYKFDIQPLGENAHYPPMYDAALLMGKGDSASIFQKVDSTMRCFLPPAAKDVSEIRFELRLLDIISIEAKTKAEEQAKNNAMALEQRLQMKIKDIKSGSLDKRITQLPSGLRILIESAGNGVKIKPGEPVQCHYFGFLAESGKSFQNSFASRKPLAFPAGAGNMIPGFDEGIMQLNHGSKAWLLIPAALAYGDQEAAGALIPPNSELFFYIEVF